MTDAITDPPLEPAEGCNTYTIFCQHKDRQGTIHIDTVQAPDLDAAILAGRENCLSDWGGGATITLEDIHCLGVAEGDVNILHWEDQYE